MNWALICMGGILLFAIISLLAMLNLARHGDQDGLQNLSVIKRMKAQALVVGRIRDEIKNPLQQEKANYKKLAKMVDELEVDAKDRE